VTSFLADLRQRLETETPFSGQTLDEAYAVHGRAPIPSTEHLLTSRSNIAAGAGAAVGSSLFGPRRGCSVAPITPPGNDEGDQLEQAIEWRESRPSLVVRDEQANLTCVPILIQ